jgi:hypothetical protein
VQRQQASSSLNVEVKSLEADIEKGLGRNHLPISARYISEQKRLENEGGPEREYDLSGIGAQFMSHVGLQSGELIWEKMG